MRADITKILTPETRLPSMPSVAMQLIELARRPNAKVSELSDLLSKDPAMAGTILRYVNSPAYSMDHEVESLERAVVIMGFKSIMNIALSFTLADSLHVQQGEGLDYPLFWRRCLLSATAARVIGHEARESALEELFLAGLLQDIGMLALDCAQPQFYRAMETPQFDHDLVQQSEKAEFGVDHAAFGAWLLRKWGVPSRLVTAVEASHGDKQFQYDEALGHFTTCVALSGIVADFFLNEGDPNVYVYLCDRLYKDLSMREEDAKRILIKVRDEIGQVADLFSKLVSSEKENQSLIAMATRAMGDRRDVERPRENFHPATPSRDVSADELTQLLASTYLDEVGEIEGVISKRAFENSLKNSLKMLGSKGSLSVVLLSIDNLRELETEHSAKVAMLLLRVVGRKLTGNVRVEDFVTRYGDTFAAILLNTSLADARHALERVVDMFSDARYSIAGGKKVSLVVSAGIAGHSGAIRFDSPDAILRAAFGALLDARRGAYQVVCVAPDTGLPGGGISEQA